MARPRSMILAMIPAALLAAGSLIGSGASFAQQPREPARAEAGPEAAPPEEAAAEVESFPILAITSVEVLRSTHAPVTDIVVVNGLTSADGWKGGELVPLRHGPSSDGVLDLVFMAEPPQESAAPTRYAPIQAILPLSSGHPFKAVRVRAATNSVLAHDLPGVAEARQQPAEPCKSCVGKLFVPKNAAPPAGVAAADVVREEDLPPVARVVHPDDGLADTRPNPNRLTIIIGEDGRIADAAWE
jgi:hypothetical protein